MADPVVGAASEAATALSAALDGWRKPAALPDVADRLMAEAAATHLPALLAEVGALSERAERYEQALQRIAATADTWNTETGGRAIVLLRIADEVDAALAPRSEDSGQDG